MQAPLRRPRVGALVTASALVLQVQACLALPSQQQFEAAVRAAAPAAQELGLSIRTDTLWTVLLRQRVPMLAVRQGNTCHIGYSAYTPGQDFAALFPALPPAQARTWLEGLVHHELTHCASATAGAAAAPPTPARTDAATRGHRRGTATAHQQESLADLGFAVHVAHADAQGLQLVARLLQLREARAAQDPLHDSSAALRCFLAHAPTGSGRSPGNPDEAPGAGQPWELRLRYWSSRCLPSDADPL